MAKFKYKARDNSGSLLEGEIEAESLQSAVSDLSAKGLFPVEIAKSGFVFDFSFLSGIKLYTPRIRIRDLMMFFDELAALFSAGIPLLEGLRAVSQQANNKYFKQVISSIEKNVNSGISFSQSLAKHPNVFSHLIVAMIESGERGGVLEDVLNKIAKYLEKENQFHTKIQAALRYPITVLIALSAAFFVIVSIVIPKFSTIYGAFGAALPWPTRILLGISYLTTSFWWLIVLVLILLYYLFKVFVGLPFGRKTWDQFLLNVPIMGELIIKISLARFFSMLSAMLGSGIPVISALEVTAGTSDNAVIQDAIFKIRDEVVKGAGLAHPMEGQKLFPPIAVQMVATGEKSGSLDKMLTKSSVYFDEEADYMIANLMSYIEPLLILFLGIMFLVLALGVFLPMWSLMDLYSH